jgi:hypothetical protein
MKRFNRLADFLLHRQGFVALSVKALHFRPISRQCLG